MEGFAFFLYVVAYLIGCFAAFGFGHLCFAAARWLNRH